MKYISVLGSSESDVFNLKKYIYFPKKKNYSYHFCFLFFKLKYLEH